MSKVDFSSVQSQQYPAVQEGQRDLRKGVIRFEKVFLSKMEDASEKFTGSIAITEDKNHKGWLHILIYIGQLFNAIFSGKSRDNVNCCHSQVIIGVNESEKRKGELLLAHGVFGGIKTTSENHKTDEVITGVYVYRPVDERMKNLFLAHAKQTAVDFRVAKLNPKDHDFKSRVKKEVPSFSIVKMITCVFHRQVLKPYEQAQKRAALAAADLLKGDKLRDENGNLESYFCTAYMMTLTQGTALVSALSEEEKGSLQVKTREEIAEELLNRIKVNNQDDLLSATYWNNSFMQVDAYHTMSYAAADVLNKSSFTMPKVTIAAAAA